MSSPNQGVRALAASLIDLCGSPWPPVDLVLLLGHSDSKPATFRVAGRDRAIPIVPCRMSPRSRFRDHFAWILAMSVAYRLVPVRKVRSAIARWTPWIRTVEACDWVGDIRGGDSFSDIYGLGRFLTGSLMAWSVVLVKGSMVHFPQTYGPYRSPVARWVARRLLLSSRLVVARDLRSQKVAQDLVGDRRRVLLSPDVAFSLESIRPDPLVLDPPPASAAASGAEWIGLNVNGLMYHGGYTRRNMFGLKLDYPRFLAGLVTALLREQDGEIWLVPHTFAPEGDVESDPQASRELRGSLPPELASRVRIVDRDYDQHHIKGVIGGCGFFVGSRMHSCIAALSQGIPCVGVAYSMKFAGVFESVGMDDWVVDGRTVSTEEAVARVVELFRRRGEVRETLARRSAEAREQLRRVFGGMVSGELLAEVGGRGDRGDSRVA